MSEWDTLYMHLDNTGSHNLKRTAECLSATQVKHVLHPARCPNLAQSDCPVGEFSEHKFMELKQVTTTPAARLAPNQHSL
jgi:hypothetical protein